MIAGHDLQAYTLASVFYKQKYLPESYILESWNRLMDNIPSSQQSHIQLALKAYEYLVPHVRVRDWILEGYNIWEHLFKALANNDVYRAYQIGQFAV